MYDAFCRFAIKLYINGYAMIDGVMSATAIDMVVNDYLRDMEIPPIYLALLKDAEQGYHISYDLVANGRLVALEINALGPRPNVVIQQIGHQPPA
jgi:hypothetical protein